ncbi:MAG: hypothetical protein RLO51_21160 [Thalassobaculum sp.]|uniref:hypothetical protein n=1 Tax=Thalassobaculum sp. TaxID=2022740 RepID=UPI0032EBE6C2
MRVGKGLILVVSEDVGVMRELAAVPCGPQRLPVEWVSGAAEALDLLGRSTNDIVLVLADKRLEDGSPFDIFRFVRRDPDAPFPGLALGLIGDALTEADIRRSAILGCLHFLGRPFQADHVVQALTQWPLDRTDFIVSGSYTGPDRRRGTRQQMVERRTVSGPAEQTVASTSLGFEIKPSTTVFRFRRMSTAESEPALSLRNGLSREAVEPARAHIKLKKEQALAMLALTRHRMDDAYAELVEKHDREALKRLNSVAREAAALTETRGLLLVGAIVRGLMGYSGDTHPPGRALLDLLRRHLEALREALAGEIVDDGGAVGRNILATLRAAEETFEAATGPTPGPPLGPTSGPAADKVPASSR